MFIIDCIMLVLLIIGGINWGSIGIFQFDIVGFLFGGQGAIVSRIVFCLVAIAAIWCISFLFREHSPLDRPKHRDHDTKHTDVGVPPPSLKKAPYTNNGVGSFFIKDLHIALLLKYFLYRAQSPILHWLE